MSDAPPIILWFRRDLRLSDHPALDAAAASGRPVVPVFIHDEVVETHGAAPKWRLGLSVEALAGSLGEIGHRLILRRGEARTVLRGLADELGAADIWWTRAYDPEGRARDEAVADMASEHELTVKAWEGHVLFEPWTVETSSGSFYSVYTPFWNAVKGRELSRQLSAPSELCAPEAWPESDDLSDWEMGAAMDRGADVVARHVHVGEAAAQSRLGTFMRDRVEDYDAARDIPGIEGTSSLSENLTYGEISARSCWHSAQSAMADGKPGAETWAQELVWRDFAYHLMWHTPRLRSDNWREKWSSFPWSEDEGTDAVMRWKQGRTGIVFVDAAMREMFVTGRMHNRARMIVASYLTKHMMCHWRIGMRWFEECLIDWDVANNSMGWQWASGPGPDATPFFRIFNPITQLDRYDKDRDYADRWIAEGHDNPHPDALSFFAAIPRSWSIAPDDEYPAPVVGHKEGRERALEAYQNRDF